MIVAKIITELPVDSRRHKQSMLNKTIAIIGYGNQGHSQAKNLRDNGFNVIIGNTTDEYYHMAQRDGFKVYDIAKASKEGDILFMLIPDEVQPKVFTRDIEPSLSDGKTLVFASAYNYYYKYVAPSKNVNVLLIAPRMIGAGVRNLFVKKEGFPVLVAVGNDYTGASHKTLMVLTDGIGAFSPGGCAIESSFREETLLDLLTEHSWAGAILFMFRAYYEVVTELGCSPEAAIMELYGSGELAEIAGAMKRMGLFKQLANHSHTSQYGQLTRGPQYVNDGIKKLLKEYAYAILDGSFAREWTIEQERGMTVYKKLHELNQEHPMEKEEERLYKLLKRNAGHKRES